MCCFSPLFICPLGTKMNRLVGYNPVNLLGGQKPAPQPVPTTTQSDLVKSIPVGMCSAGAHGASVLALGADPLFGQVGVGGGGQSLPLACG